MTISSAETSGERRGRRLLIVVNIPRFFLSHRLALALAAQDAGFDVHIATAEGDEGAIERIRAHGLTIHTFPMSQHGRAPLTEIRSLLSIILLHRRLRPDIAHHITIKPVLYGGIAARLSGRPPVVAAMSGLGRTFRDDRGGSRRPSKIFEMALRFALPQRTTHLLFQNPEDLQLFAEMKLCDGMNSSVIRGSGVDADEFSPRPEPSGTPVALFAGRLMRQKGVEEFIRAAEILRDRVIFEVAGIVEEDAPGSIAVDQLEEWAQAGTIRWLGPRTDMAEVIAGVSIVVLPSVYGEGVPRILIEAAASGRAIVTTDAPGCREICKDRVNGLLVPGGDASALAAAIAELAADPQLRQRYGEAGRAIALEGFTLDTVIQATLDLYDRLSPAA